MLTLTFTRVELATLYNLLVEALDSDQDARDRRTMLTHLHQRIDDTLLHDAEDGYR